MGGCFGSRHRTDRLTGTHFLDIVLFPNQPLNVSMTRVTGHENELIRAFCSLLSAHTFALHRFTQNSREKTLWDNEKAEPLCQWVHSQKNKNKSRAGFEDTMWMCIWNECTVYRAVKMNTHTHIWIRIIKWGVVCWSDADWLAACWQTRSQYVWKGMWAQTISACVCTCSASGM